jgi:sulfite reductase (ferredoxin)
LIGRRREKALSLHTVDTTALRSAIAAPLLEVQRSEAAAFEAWKKINVIPQKQAGMWHRTKYN